MQSIHLDTFNWESVKEDLLKYFEFCSQSIYHSHTHFSSKTLSNVKLKDDLLNVNSFHDMFKYFYKYLLYFMSKDIKIYPFDNQRFNQAATHILYLLKTYCLDKNKNDEVNISINEISEYLNNSLRFETNEVFNNAVRLYQSIHIEPTPEEESHMIGHLYSILYTQQYLK